MRTYCRHHDIVLCERHAGECMGGARCDPRPDDIPETDVTCSVCCGILKPLDERR